VQKILEGLANATGILGMICCIIAGLARIAGIYHLAGFEALTLFNLGVGAMVMGGIIKLEVILREIRGKSS